MSSYTWLGVGEILVGAVLPPRLRDGRHPRAGRLARPGVPPGLYLLFRGMATLQNGPQALTS